MKNFVKAMDRDVDGFKFLKDLFGAEKTDAKLEAEVFVGPEIRKLMQNEGFGARLRPLELAAGNAMKSVVVNVLGSHRHKKYPDIIDSMLKANEQLDACMSWKMPFLRSHLAFFPSNLGEVSDEQEERFHQNISVIEGRYQGRYDANMMGDFCWYYNVRARAHHTREKPNARNIFKAISWCIIKLKAFVVCCNNLFSAKLYFADCVRCVRKRKTAACGYLKNVT